MPLLSKIPFVPRPHPDNLQHHEDVFFLVLSKEIFRNYDEFFERTIHLNSMIWTCAVTGRSGLTFEEALESEKEAQASLDTFPEFLETPLLYLVHKLTCRGRIDDLVTDLQTFMKERYFVDEELIFTESGRKKRARILHVFHCDDSREKQSALKTNLKIPSASCYLYNIQIVQRDSDDENSDSDEDSNSDGRRYDVTCAQLSRVKNLVPRAKLKLFLKNSCAPQVTRWTVKSSLVNDYRLDDLQWSSIFCGPLPEFPNTPISKRHSSSEIKSPLLVDQQQQQLMTTTKKKTMKKGETRKDRKLRKAIEKQREELKLLFSQAYRMGVEQVNTWTRNAKLLTETDIAHLREAIKQGKHRERERVKQEKQRLREQLLAWRRPRDDLQCNDLMPLPAFTRLQPPWFLPATEFGTFLSVLQFFHSFDDLLSIDDYHRSTTVTLDHLLEALVSPVRTSPLVDLFTILLRAKAERGDEEDGDEANLTSKEEVSLDNCDLDHKKYGTLIRDATLQHEKVRLVHGQSARHLPVDAFTFTEVIRLNIETSGYYTGQVTARFQYTHRGGFHCWDDEGFVFKLTHESLVRKLRTQSVFDLNPRERLLLLKMFCDQLLGFYGFRQAEDDLVGKLCELKKDLKNLKAWQQQQEKEAKTARLILEYEADQLEAEACGVVKTEEKPSASTPSKNTQLLKTWLRAKKERIPTASRRNNELIISQMLEGIAFDELNIDEIDQARQFQLDLVQEEETQLLKSIFKCQSKCGMVRLGRDRAFRSYFYMETLPAILVESPTEEDHIGCCTAATPLDEDDQPLKNPQSLTSLTFYCTGLPHTCPVHSLDQHASRWWLLSSRDQLTGLLSSCQARGVRESELADSLRFYWTELQCLVDESQRVVNSMAIGNRVDTATEDWDGHVRELMLDLEEKVYTGGIGGVKTTIRDEWRRLLFIDGNVSSLTDSVTIMDEVVLTHDQLTTLDLVGNLALCLLQIAQSVNVKFLRLPFATSDDQDQMEQRGSKSSETCSIATESFALWQKSLLECWSLSSVVLHYSTLEPSIVWSKSRHRAKCRTCRRKGGPTSLVLCTNCHCCYHLDCVRPKLAHVDSDWLCADCRISTKATTNSLLADDNDRLWTDADLFDDGRDERPSEEKCAQCEQSLRDQHHRRNRISCSECATVFHEDCIERANRNRSQWRCGRCEMHKEPQVKTASGRVVKKTRQLDSYASESQSIPARKRAKRTTVSENGHDDDDDDDDDDDYDYEPSNGKGTRTILVASGHVLVEDPHQTNERTAPSLNTGLRDGNWGRCRDLWRRCDLVVKEAMLLPCAWAFREPVDEKQVPDYYQVIDSPMSLRTMLNKIKNRDYDCPDQLRQDARLISHNCHVYNTDESDISQDSNELCAFLNERFDQFFADSGPETNKLVIGRKPSF